MLYLVCTGIKGTCMVEGSPTSHPDYIICYCIYIYTQTEIENSDATELNKAEISLNAYA